MTRLLAVLPLLLPWVRLPGFIRSGEYYGHQPDKYIVVRTSPRYTVLTAAGTEYYFRREDGKYDGYGRVVES